MQPGGGGGDRDALAGALRLTDLRGVLDAVVEQALAGLRGLAGRLPGQQDDDRCGRLLQALGPPPRGTLQQASAAGHRTSGVVEGVPVSEKGARLPRGVADIYWRPHSGHARRTRAGQACSAAYVSMRHNKAFVLLRKRGLLTHLGQTRQRLLRLLIVAQWANKVITPGWQFEAALHPASAKLQADFMSACSCSAALQTDRDS